MNKMLVAKIKLFRMKYGISRAELGSACGISKQRIYELENEVAAVTPATTDKLRRGMEAVLTQRKTWIDAFRMDLEKHRDTLMDYVEENRYEL